MATLSHKEMKAVIDGGGSVIYKGRHISRVDDLPSAADLAKGDAAQEQATAADLQQQIDALRAELAKVQPKQEKSTHFQPPKQTDKDAK